jgi:hypothetical protein
MAFSEQDEVGGEMLKLATAALRETGIMEGPAAEMLARAEAIPSAKRRRPLIPHPLMLAAASIALVVVALAAFFLLQQAGGVAFADVVQALRKTRTFTAQVSLPIPSQQRAPKGMRYLFNVSVKGEQIRAESLGFTIVADQNAGKMMFLMPMLHQAGVQDIDGDPKKFDLYSMVRDYHDGTEKPVGEKTVNGRKTLGFQVSRPADEAGQVPDVWTFWVDPETKLPVEIMLLDRNLAEPIAINQLRFDVPLEDGLFDMTIPAGYALIADPAKVDPWEHRKYSGQVVDQHGKPLAGVEVQAIEHEGADSEGFGGGLAEAVKTDREGRFSIDAGYPNNTRVAVGMDTKGTLQSSKSDFVNDSAICLEFRSPDHLYARLEDLHLFPPAQRQDLHIRLRDGQSVAGKVIDAAGRPVAGAMVRAIYGDPKDWEIRYDYGRMQVTDAQGKFALHGLAATHVVLQVRRTDAGAEPLWGQAKLNLQEIPKETPQPLEIVVKPLMLPAGKAVHMLFGMKLVDLDDDLRTLLSLDELSRVLILDPGNNVTHLRIGEPQQGDCFSWAGEGGSRIKDFDDFTQRLLAAAEDQKQRGLTDYRVKVAYQRDRSGTGEQNGDYFITLNARDVEELERVVKGTAGPATQPAN